MHYAPRSHRSYKTNDIVLVDVNLQVDSGEMIYLIGKVGSGKSTLLKSLYGELPIQSGRGSVAGFDLGRLKRRQIPYLRRKLGIVFQNMQLLPDRNVFENLRFVLKATGWKEEREITQRIHQILKLVNLAHKAYRKPHNLSGGEQQRLSIGRAFVNHPSIILADEPTANLDPLATQEIMELFVDICKMGCSVVIATHDLSIIERYPGRILHFKAGEVTELDASVLLGTRAPQTAAPEVAAEIAETEIVLSESPEQEPFNEEN